MKRDLLVILFRSPEMDWHERFLDYISRGGLMVVF